MGLALIEQEGLVHDLLLSSELRLSVLLGFGRNLVGFGALGVVHLVVEDVFLVRILVVLGGFGSYVSYFVGIFNKNLEHFHVAIVDKGLLRVFVDLQIILSLVLNGGLVFVFVVPGRELISERQSAGQVGRRLVI